MTKWYFYTERALHYFTYPKKDYWIHSNLLEFGLCLLHQRVAEQTQYSKVS
jgi:hypothetical protein